jgi:hypothetical protein
MKMTKKLLATVAVLGGLMTYANAALSAEILFAVMSDEAGKVAVHTVNLKDGYCVALVKKFIEDAKKGTTPITLTLPNPTFTGTVIEAYCVMPDGSTNPTFKAPTT